MAVKSKIDIFKNMTKTELEREISKHVACYRYYQRLMVLKMISDGYTITEAANEIKRAYPTVHKWVSTCEKEGLKGLRPNFTPGGAKSKLTKDQLKELDRLINAKPDMKIKDLVELIDKRYGVKYSPKQVRIITGKLGYEYKTGKNFYKPEFEEE